MKASKLERFCLILFFSLFLSLSLFSEMFTYMKHKPTAAAAAAIPTKCIELPTYLPTYRPD